MDAAAQVRPPRRAGEPWQIEGPDPLPLLQLVFARDVGRLGEGRGRHAIARTHAGGTFMDGILDNLTDFDHTMMPSPPGSGASSIPASRVSWGVPRSWRPTAAGSVFSAWSARPPRRAIAPR